MSEQTDVEPINPTDEVDTVLREEPTSIAEALDLDVKLAALSGWVNDRKRAVAGWVQTKAEGRLAEDGAAPTWRLDDGVVLLTDPEAKPRIADSEAFARWYVANLLGRDPDEEHDQGEYVRWFDDRVARRTHARADSTDLLRFLDGMAQALTGDADDAVAVAEALVSEVQTDEEWMVGEATLADLLAGKLYPSEGERPRISTDTNRLVLVDAETGETPIPGTVVAPPSARAVQMRPSADAKKRVRSELDRLLGPAELGQ